MTTINIKFIYLFRLLDGVLKYRKNYLIKRYIYIDARLQKVAL